MPGTSPGMTIESVARACINIVIASAAKQSRLSPWKDSGLLRSARNDGGANPLPYRRRVLHATRVPQLVHPARDLQLRLLADVALVHLAVIADVADDADDPVLGEAELLAVIALGADQPHHFRLLRLQGFVDVLR